MGEPVKILIDTHVFLWALADPDRLGQQRRQALEIPTNRVYVSSVSIAELMIKASIGKIAIDFDPVEMTTECGFEPLDFCGTDALLLRDLPFHHRDPFDRMLIAQAIAHDLPVMTTDVKFHAYDCKSI